MSEFEGDFIDGMELRIPATAIEVDEAFTRGTHLRMEIEFRVKSVRYEEGRKGDLVRQHVLAVDSVSLRASFQPEDRADVLGGNLTANTIPTPEMTEELGMQIRRTSDLWGNGRSVPVADDTDLRPTAGF